MHSSKTASGEPPVGQVPENEKPDSSTLPPYQRPEVAYPPPQPIYPQSQGTYPPLIGVQPTTFQTTNTTVVIAQPSMMVVQQQCPRQWHTGLCGCFEGCGVCCMGFFCAGCLLCDISSRMGEGCCFPCYCPQAVAGLRVKLRTQENIEGTMLDDYCCAQCCTSLVLCQMARELKHIGK